MTYIELSCHPVVIADLLIARLADLGFESFLEEDGKLMAYITMPLYVDTVKQTLDSAEFRAMSGPFVITEIPDQNWNAVWESAYDPVVIQSKCMVRAPFHKPIQGIEYDIVIEPKMSFGTAHHETTSLMIRYLLEMDVAHKALLDMGSGTAVLAILAAMKGAEPVTAIDNDEWAYNNANENVRHNNKPEIEVLLGDSSLLLNRQFNIVLANINRNILLNDIPVYAACLPLQGKLIMSGFYEEDLPVIREKAEFQGLKLLSSKSDNRWTAACFIRE